MTWAPDYLTLGQMKGWLRLTDTNDDVELATCITAASRAVDRCTGRQFGQVAVAETRTYRAEYDGRCRAWLVEHDDLGDLTGFQVAIDGTAVTAYSFEPLNALAKGRVYTRLRLGSGAESFPGAAGSLVELTGRWGWPSVPATVQQAVKTQAHRFFARRDSPFGIAGSPDAGNELRLLAKVDPDVELMLNAYRRRWFAA